MRTIHGPKTRAQLRYRRHLRVRRKVSGTAERPRLVVYRSLKHIYAQLVNDELGVTLLGVSDNSEGLEADGGGKVGRAKGTGKLLAREGQGSRDQQGSLRPSGLSLPWSRASRRRRRARGRIGVLDG